VVGNGIGVLSKIGTRAFRMAILGAPVKRKEVPVGEKAEA
jgi:hypothetical protein